MSSLLKAVLQVVVRPLFFASSLLAASFLPGGGRSSCERGRCTHDADFWPQAHSVQFAHFTQISVYLLQQKTAGCVAVEDAAVNSFRASY